MPAAKPRRKINRTRANANENSLPSHNRILVIRFHMVAGRQSLFDRSAAGRPLEKSATASVLLASEDSQIGVRMRVCLYGQDRTHRSSSRRSGAACETGERSQHAAEDRVAVADRAFGRRGDWRGRGGEEGGQERAHRAPLAATLRGQGGWRGC